MSVLLLTSCFNILIMIIFQSTWPQLDISSCSYQSYSVIALILLYLAAPFFYSHRLFLFGISHIFNKTIKNCEKERYYTLVTYMQCTINTCVCFCSSHPVTGDLTLITWIKRMELCKEPAAYS